MLVYFLDLVHSLPVGRFCSLHISPLLYAVHWHHKSRHRPSPFLLSRCCCLPATAPSIWTRGPDLWASLACSSRCSQVVWGNLGPAFCRGWILAQLPTFLLLQDFGVAEWIGSWSQHLTWISVPPQPWWWWTVYPFLLPLPQTTGYHLGAAEWITVGLVVACCWDSIFCPTFVLRRLQNVYPSRLRETACKPHLGNLKLS